MFDTHKGRTLDGSQMGATRKKLTIPRLTLVTQRRSFWGTSMTVSCQSTGVLLRGIMIWLYILFRNIIRD